jgi:hypothetical protein
MNTQQFGSTKLKPLTDQDIQKLDNPAPNQQNLPPIPDDNDPFVQARKQREEAPKSNPKKDEMEDKAINMHPVLKKLKRTLGINTLEVFYETIYIESEMIKFGMTEYPEDLNIWCLSESRRLLASGLEEEKALKAFDILRVGCSLVSIDGTPAYEVYGIKPRQDELRSNAFDMSDRLRQAVAIEFHKFVMNEGRAFIDILEEFWQENILNRVNIARSSSAKALKDDECAYVCEVAGCTFTHVGKRSQSYFCINHSTTLKKALTTDELDSIPFP